MSQAKSAGPLLQRHSLNSFDGDDQVSLVAHIESCVPDIDRNKLKSNRDKKT